VKSSSLSFFTALLFDHRGKISRLLLPITAALFVSEELTKKIDQMCYMEYYCAIWIQNMDFMSEERKVEAVHMWI